MNAASYTRGAPDLLGASTLLDAIFRTPGSVADCERELAGRLVRGDLHLTGTFRGQSREIGREVLTDGR